MLPSKLRSLSMAAALGVAFAASGLAGAQAQTPKVAIALFGPHPSLQQVVDGFKEELAAEGVEANYDEGNVNFDRSLVPQFLNRLNAGDPDLMLTITTPMTQSAKQILAARDYPVVFAPVTDPVKAGLVPSWEHGAPLMTGASNIPDFGATLDFMKSLVPDLAKLGILFNPGDDSDTAFVNEMKKAVEGSGVEIVEIGVENANDIPLRVRSAQGRVQAMFVPASSLLQPASAAIASAANSIGLPVFGSNTQSVENHQALGALAVDFHRVGINAGKIAARLLKGEKAEDVAVSVPSRDDHLPRISGQRLGALGLSLPANLKDCGCVVE